MKYYVIAGKSVIYYGIVTSTKHSLKKVYKKQANGSFKEFNSTTNDEAAVYAAQKKGILTPYLTLEAAEEAVK